MKQLLVLLFCCLLSLAYANTVPTTYLPSFPNVNYQNITFGKEVLAVPLAGDKCSSKSGGCSASCNNAGCLCHCGPGGCSCQNPVLQKEGVKDDGMHLTGVKVTVTQESINTLCLSAEFFKNYNTAQTDVVYMYMYRIATALNANDENLYKSLVLQCNELTNNLPINIRSAYNQFAESKNITVRI